MSDEKNLTPEEIAKGIDSLELGDMSGEENYLKGLKRQLDNHWSKIKGKLTEDVDFKIKYTGIGAEPYIKMGKKIKEVALTDLGDMAGEKSYLAGLKKHVKKHAKKVKEKLNEDVNLKIEYTGIGTEPFVELGKKIKNHFSAKTNVLLLGQDSHYLPINVDSDTGAKTITLDGNCYDHNLQSYDYFQDDNKMNFIGSNSGHAINNILKKDINKAKAFLIYISLASNDPLDEFYQYMELIEKHETDKATIMLIFLLEEPSQHNVAVLIETIRAEYKQRIEIMNIKNNQEEMKFVGRRLNHLIFNREEKSLNQSSHVCNN